jgi:mannan polymerase II complex MNN10 subunit
MKALCSIGAGPQEELLEIARPTFAGYAERHGYELITSTEVDPDRPASWSKVPMLRELVESYELVFWIDADAVIVDASRDVADELEPASELGMVRHRRGDDMVPNAGVIVVRGGEFAKELLDRLWASTRYIHHPWWENAALLEAFGYELPGDLDPARARRLVARLRPRPLRLVQPSRFLERTQFLPADWNSVYPDWAEHSRILHFPGAPLDVRKRDMIRALGG